MAHNVTVAQSGIDRMEADGNVEDDLVIQDSKKTDFEARASDEGDVSPEIHV